MECLEVHIVWSTAHILTVKNMLQCSPVYPQDMAPNVPHVLPGPSRQDPVLQSHPGVTIGLGGSGYNFYRRQKVYIIIFGQVSEANIQSAHHVWSRLSIIDALFTLGHCWQQCCLDGLYFPLYYFLLGIQPSRSSLMDVSVNIKQIKICLYEYLGLTNFGLLPWRVSETHETLESQVWHSGFRWPS